MARFYVKTLVKSTPLVALLMLATTSAIQLSIGVEHDLTEPTYGLQGRSSSSMSYDDRNGLQMSGTVNDILGPPVKMANGFKQMLAGSNMAGVGSSLKSGSAVLGIDSKLLEAAGGASMLKGGLLMGGAAAKVGAAKVVGGLPGKKIASIIELPVKVVALKDLAAGKTMYGLSRVKQQQAQQANTKGENMIREGQALKSQGMKQMMQGASEGMQNIGNMMQQTAENTATAFKFLPIIMDLPTPNGSSSSSAGTKGAEQQVEQQQQQQQLEMPPYQAAASSHGKAGSITGGSLFGGLGSLVPGLTSGGSNGGMHAFGSVGSQSQSQQPFENMFAPFMNHNGYAAVLNATNPFTNMIMNPMANPFLLPFTGANNMFETGPLRQHSSATKTHSGNSNAATNHYNYNLLPGLKFSETTSSSAPNLLADSKISASKLIQKQPPQHHAIKQQQQDFHVEQQQQQQVVDGVTKS